MNYTTIQLSHCLYSIPCDKRLECVRFVVVVVVVVVFNNCRHFLRSG